MAIISKSNKFRAFLDINARWFVLGIFVICNTEQPSTRRNISWLTEPLNAWLARLRHVSTQGIGWMVSGPIMASFPLGGKVVMLFPYGKMMFLTLEAHVVFYPFSLNMYCECVDDTSVAIRNKHCMLMF